MNTAAIPQSRSFSAPASGSQSPSQAKPKGGKGGKGGAKGGKGAQGGRRGGGKGGGNKYSVRDVPFFISSTMYAKPLFDPLTLIFHFPSFPGSVAKNHLLPECHGRG